MSTWRNAAKRKTHKERHQPEARERYGLLEKHKDYVLRAKDFNSKKQRLKALQQKATTKNPDEFYFQMHSSSMKNGVHRDDSGTSLDVDTVRLLKSQDANYVLSKLAAETNKIERLKSTLHLIGVGAGNTHTVFVDDAAAVDAFDAAAHFDTHEDVLGRAANRPRTGTLLGSVCSGVSKKTVDQVNKKRDASYRELTDRMARQKELKAVAGELQAQRNLMGKGKKKKVGSGAKGGKQFKWKQERKK